MNLEKTKGVQTIEWLLVGIAFLGLAMLVGIYAESAQFLDQFINSQ